MKTCTVYLPQLDATKMHDHDNVQKHLTDKAIKIQ